MKALILDSGPLINLSMNGLLEILEKMKRPDLEFYITEAVKREIVDTPANIPRFELGALRIQQLIQEGTIKIAVIEGLEERTRKFLSMINCTLETEGQCIRIVSEAEISCLALSTILEEKGVETLIAIDERTTRVLFENIDALEQIMAKRLHKRIKIKNKDFKKIGQFRFIRSTEIVFVAHKQGLTGLEGKKALEALLYATKYKGAAVSEEEIEQLKKL